MVSQVYAVSIDVCRCEVVKSLECLASSQVHQNLSYQKQLKLHRGDWNLYKSVIVILWTKINLVIDLKLCNNIIKCCFDLCLSFRSSHPAAVMFILSFIMKSQTLLHSQNHRYSQKFTSCWCCPCACSTCTAIVCQKVRL